MVGFPAQRALLAQQRCSAKGVAAVQPRFSVAFFDH